jgi:hypothetical protein
MTVSSAYCPSIMAVVITQVCGEPYITTHDPTSILVKINDALRRFYHVCCPDHCV